MKLHELLEHRLIESATINGNVTNLEQLKDQTGEVNVMGDVDISIRCTPGDLVKLPVKFGKVSGYFNCGYCKRHF